MTPALSNFTLTSISFLKPDDLVKLTVISDREVFNSALNSAWYTIYDQQSNLYYTFENKGATDLIQELGTCIKIVIKKGKPE